MNGFRLNLACMIHRSAVVTLEAWTFFWILSPTGTGITTHSERLIGDRIENETYWYRFEAENKLLSTVLVAFIADQTFCQSLEDTKHFMTRDMRFPTM